MKLPVIAFSSLLVFSMISSASSINEFVACGDLGAEEYNVLLVLENGKASAYSTLESNFQGLISVSPSEKSLFVTYASEYDTNFQYDIQLSNQMSEVIVVETRQSGNNSDNYFGYPTNTSVVCHLLKSKPESNVVSSDNYQSSVKVEKK